MRAQFVRQRGKAIGFLVANMSNVADRRRPSAKQATAAKVITVSLMSFMSTSMPWSGPPCDPD